MNIRILFCLAACIVLITACKKDNNKNFVHGVVINKMTNQPIAGAELSLHIPSLGGNISAKPYSTAVSNNKGEYSLAMPKRTMSLGFDILQVKKDALLQASYPGGYMSPRFDTVYMEDASYLKLVVKVTNPVPAAGLRFNCVFIESVLQPLYYHPLNELPQFSQPRTDTLVFPFSVTRHPTAKVFFYTKTTPPLVNDSVVFEKSITPTPYSITQVTVEY